MTPKHADWIERAALSASTLCLIHCLALPLLFAALPALSGVLALPEDVHLFILLFAVPSSLLALLAGRTGHGADYPLAAGSIGLILLATAILPLFAVYETPITVGGSLMLASAHVMNWRLRHARHDHS